MTQLPNTDDPLVIRTDFRNNDGWEKICSLLSAPVLDHGDEFYAYVTFLSDPAFDSFSKERLLDALPKDYHHSLIMVVDSVTLSHAEHPVLVVDLWELRGREFRATPTQIQSIENNLSIANMDFHEFADSVDSDSIFRGF